MEKGFFGFRPNIDQSALLFKTVLWYLGVSPAGFSLWNSPSKMSFNLLLPTYIAEGLYFIPLVRGR